MKNNLPVLPKILCEGESLSDSLLTDEDELERHRFRNAVAGDILKEHFSVNTCLFDHCNFAGSRFTKCHFCDVVFQNCDLSNVSLSGCSFCRVEFVECRLTGTILSEGTFMQVAFRSCRGRYADFSMGKLKGVRFFRTDLHQSAISNCHLKEVFFEGCDLSEAELHGTSLAGIDLTDSEIAGIRLSMMAGNELKGASVSMLQAVDLARMLGGVIVRED